jgi:translation initiation factor 2B subunit (eIF-2B alpha/beta/delta family)
MNVTVVNVYSSAKQLHNVLYVFVYSTSPSGEQLAQSTADNYKKQGYIVVTYVREVLE